MKICLFSALFSAVISQCGLFLNFLNALLSTNSMYNAISHCITKNISHASTRQNKKKPKGERVHKHQFTNKYKLHIFYVSIGCYKAVLIEKMYMVSTIKYFLM